MTDNRESDDAADWLSAQFGSHEPDEPKATDSDTEDSSKDASDAERAESGTPPAAHDADPAPSWMPAAPTTPAAPAAPGPPASSGFSWGLTPSNAQKGPVAPNPDAPELATPGPTAQAPSPIEPEAPPQLAAPLTVQTLPAEQAVPSAPVSPAVPASPAPPASAAPPFSPPRLVPSPPESAPFTSPAQPVTPEATGQPPASPAPPSHPDSRFAPPPLVSPPLAPPVAPPAAGVPVAPMSLPLGDLASEPAESGLPGADSQVSDPGASEQPVPTKARPWPFSRRHGAVEGAEEPEQPGTPGTPGAAEGTGAPNQPEHPQPFDASLGGVPSAEAEPLTMALPWESAGTELFTPVAASDAVAEPATELLSGFDTTPADAAAGSSIDSLFGESQFRDYDAEPAALPNPLTPAVPAATASKPKRLPVPRSQKVLLWIVGVLAALLILIALFYLGTRIPQSAAAPVPTPTVTASPTPSPTPTVAAVGPLAAGTYKWDRLLGGECLAPFDTPWAETFTVVDCATPHAAQMVARGVFSEPAAAATDPSAPATPAVGQSTASTYPGVAVLQTQINLLCSAPTVIDFGAAGAYTDIQFVASYPATDKQWADGDRNYYCFVTRSSGDPLTTSVAVPPAAPAQ